MARSCHRLERHGAHLVTDVTCTFFGRIKRKWLNEHIPIPTNTGNRGSLRWGRMTRFTGWQSFTSVTSCFRYFAFNINNTWRKFHVTAFSIKLLRAGWVPTTKPRSQMKQWSRQHPLEDSFWIHSVSCNCLEASDGRCWTQICLTLQPSLSCLVLPWKNPSATIRHHPRSIYSPCYMVLASLSRLVTIWAIPSSCVINLQSGLWLCVTKTIPLVHSQCWVQLLCNSASCWYSSFYFLVRGSCISIFTLMPLFLHQGLFTRKWQVRSVVCFFTTARKQESC